MSLDVVVSPQKMLLFKAYLKQVDIEKDAKQQKAKFKYESKFSNWNF